MKKLLLPLSVLMLITSLIAFPSAMARAVGSTTPITVVPHPVSTGEFCEQRICTGYLCVNSGRESNTGLNRTICHGSSIWVDGTCFNTYQGPCVMAQSMTGPNCAAPAIGPPFVKSTATFCSAS